MPKHIWFRLFPVRSPLLRESLLFSFPPGNEMFQFPGFAPCKQGTMLPWWVAPFGYLRINSYLPIPAACRSLSRPSSPLRAKASSVRPFLLSLALPVSFRKLTGLFWISPLRVSLKTLFQYPACQRTLPFTGRLVWKGSDLLVLPPGKPFFKVIGSR